MFWIKSYLPWITWHLIVFLSQNESHWSYAFSAWQYDSLENNISHVYLFTCDIIQSLPNCMKNDVWMSLNNIIVYVELYYMVVWLWSWCCLISITHNAEVNHTEGWIRSQWIMRPIRLLSCCMRNNII